MDTKRSAQGPDDRERPGGRPRRPWKAPALVEYGPVGKLTQNMTGSSADGGGGGMLMMGTCL